MLDRVNLLATLDRKEAVDEFNTYINTLLFHKEDPAKQAQEYQDKVLKAWMGSGPVPVEEAQFVTTKMPKMGDKT